MASKKSTKKATTAKSAPTVKKSYTEPGYKVTRGKTTTAYGIAQAEKFAQKKATANKATKVDKNKLVSIATKNPQKNDLKPIATKKATTKSTIASGKPLQKAPKPTTSGKPLQKAPKDMSGKTRPMPTTTTYKQPLTGKISSKKFQ